MGCILFVSPSISTHSLAPTPSAAERGCAHGCGRQIGAENCADGCGRRGCKMCKGVAGNGSGEEAAGDGRAWLRGRLRTANGWGELRGRLPTAWVQGSGWKWVRQKPLGMSELGCADGCGREMGAENCAADLQRLLLPTHFQPLPRTLAVRNRPRNSGPFAVRSRPQPSAQPSSLITSGFFSPPISIHSLAPTPSAAVRAILYPPFSRPQPSAQPSSLITSAIPTHFQPLRYTHAVRSRPRNSPHPFPVRNRSQARSSPAYSSPHPFPAAQFSAPISRPQPSAQPSSLITSGFFSPPISSHSLAPTPSAAVRTILLTHFPSAAVRAATLADLQRLFLPTHFQPLPCTHAVRSRPRNSPHPFPVRSRPRSQARSSPATSSPTYFQPIPCTRAVRSHPRNSPGHLPSAAVRAATLAHFPSGFFSPTISSQQSCAQFSAPISRPQPSAQPSSLITSAILSTHFPSATVRAAKLADLQRLLLPTHFQPLPGTHTVRIPCTIWGGGLTHHFIGINCVF